MDIEQAIRSYLPNILHMSFATCAGNKPWVCEVHFVYDDDLNLYFRSLLSRRHSQELAHNPNVAGNIVTQHPLGEKPRGVYFEGTAEMLQNIDEHHPSFNLFRNRLQINILEDIKKGHELYKITVSTFYLFDSRESHPSQKYELKWK